MTSRSLHMQVGICKVWNELPHTRGLGGKLRQAWPKFGPRLELMISGPRRGPH